MKTLITGREGFIGSAFDKPGYYIDSMSIRVIGNLVAQREYFADVDSIYHLGAVSGIQTCEANRRLALSLNVKATQLYLELAKALKVPLFFASSFAVTGDKNFYASTKLMGEMLCEYYREKHNLKTSILRLSNVYGPGSINKTSVVASMFKDAYTKGEITINNGSSDRDFIYVDDVVDSFHAAKYERLLLLNVCTGVSTKIYTLGYMIAELTGANVKTSDYRPGFIKGSTVAPTLPLEYTKLEDGLEKTNLYFRGLLT